MSSVICKFYQQGNCRFGKNCRYEHDRGGGNAYTSVLLHQNYVANNNNNTFNQTPTKTIDLNTLIQAVTNDMTSLEKGGQWIFSCYAPFSEKPLFPGFEDLSFEEVRSNYYVAQRNGTGQQYLQQFQPTAQKAINMIKALQNPNQEIVTLISSIYNSPPGTSSTAFLSNNLQSSPVVQKNNTGSIFGQTGTGGAFAQNSPQQQSFGGGIFAQANQQFFGVHNPTTTPKPASLFSSPPAQQANQFGPSVAPLPQAGSFSFLGQMQTLQKPAEPQPVNNQNTSIFSNAFNPAPNLQNTASNTPLFKSPSLSIFAVPQQSSSPQPFNQNNAAVSSNVFLKTGPPQVTPVLTQQPSQFSSIFGGTQVQPNVNNVNATNASNKFDDGIYSKLENLSESEIKSFQSERFIKGSIPEKPPTRELCY